MFSWKRSKVTWTRYSVFIEFVAVAARTAVSPWGVDAILMTNSFEQVAFINLCKNNHIIWYMRIRICDSLHCQPQIIHSNIKETSGCCLFWLFQRWLGYKWMCILSPHKMHAHKSHQEINRNQIKLTSTCFAVRSHGGSGRARAIAEFITLLDASNVIWRTFYLLLCR